MAAQRDAWLNQFLKLAIQEDAPDGDHTSRACIPPEARCQAVLQVKDDGVLAGVEVAEFIFTSLDPGAKLEILKDDGAAVSFGDVAFRVECNTRAFLLAERLVLNVMQRMSGIATLSNHFLFEVEDLPVTVLDTRKTTPLVRFLEKWAVRLGGCSNYRFNLSDRFLIKDNHIDACGSIRAAIEKVAAYKSEHQLELPVTVEVRNLVELYEVMEAGQGCVDRIMFDNFELPLLKEGVDIVGGKFETEASGGVTIHNIRKVAKTGVNFISVGALTHSAQSLDLSLKIVG
ncbi:MAG: carboxylating nicotinate-nucleotide diphosphorylase [Bacteroidetes bacterium]|nr:MAG: carboxylating nicotinate-nucleotide diphosphorylase [Bacteroidota bacterium]